MRNFLDIATTPTIQALREQRGSAGLYDSGAAVPEVLTEDERAMITTRDSFYMATVNEDGWPYVQHRGGDAGFVKVLGPTTIGWLERNGNRQYLGTGNITADDRVAIILVDYPSRSRLKLLGRAVHHPDPSPELIERLGGAGIRQDGAVTVEVEATNWNCPKYITPRYTEAQVAGLVEHLTGRIEDLEAENERLLDQATGPAPDAAEPGPVIPARPDRAQALASSSGSRLKKTDRARTSP